MQNESSPSNPEPASKDVRPVELLPTAPKKKSNPAVWLTFAVVLAMIVTSGLTAGITAWIVRADLDNSRQITLSEQPVSQGVGVVEKVADSVVSITTESERYDWFGRRAVSSGAGSGFIITKDGYILTNNHVVEGADVVLVVMTDDEEYQARVIATDAQADLALIKINEGNDFKPVELGDSNAAKVGEEVYAIGNALGQYPNSVTKGIISGLGRPITAVSGGLRGSLQEFEDLIQTDAAINSGNSGGPLVNAEGKVIGINTAVAGEAQNVGFSVPIDRANELVARSRNE